MRLIIYAVRLFFNYIIYFILLFVQVSPVYSQSIYIPHNDNANLTIDGSINDWKSVTLITGLNETWFINAKDQTRFFSLTDSSYLYFCFYVVDTSIVVNKYEGEFSVDLNDRVELFLSKDSNLNDYYCIEIDAGGHILDYQASFYRIFNTEWNFTDITVGSRIDRRNYVVEGKISLKELQSLGIVFPFYLGVFRADYYGSNQQDAYWFSGIDPKTESPDFHVPSAFRLVRSANHYKK